MKYLIVLASLLILYSPPSFAEENKVIHVGSPIWEGVVNKDGSGAYLDAIRAALALSGLSLKHSVMPFSRASKLVLYNDIDAIVGAHKGIDKRYLYPKWHVDMGVIMAVYKKIIFHIGREKQH